MINKCEQKYLAKVVNTKLNISTQCLLDSEEEAQEFIDNTVNALFSNKENIDTSIVPMAYQPSTNGVQFSATPFEDTMQSAMNIQSNLKCNVEFCSELQEKNDCVGALGTTKTGEYLIEISSKVSVEDALQVLAHELVTLILVARGEEAQDKNSDKYKAVYDELLSEYRRYCTEKYNLDKKEEEDQDNE